jgi:Flp pilus assembly protein TadG
MTCPPKWSPWRDQDNERGSLTLFAVVLAFGLLAMAGLVIDGGTKLTAQRRANHLAEQAARAGAQSVDLATVRAGQPALHPASARAAAARYLAATGHRGRITVGTDTVEVTVADRQPTVVLGLLGIQHLNVTGRGRARLLIGITEARP